MQPTLYVCYALSSTDSVADDIIDPRRQDLDKGIVKISSIITCLLEAENSVRIELSSDSDSAEPELIVVLVASPLRVAADALLDLD